jgi:xanthine/uracil permease
VIADSNGHGTVTTGVRERPLGELFQELAQDTRTLVSLELDLAKTELTTKATETGKDVGFLAAGGFVAYAGFLAIIAAIVIGLANFIPAWLSALLVGVVVAVIGYVLIRKGLNDLKKRDFKPTQTIDSLKADKEWLQERAR